ncbi:uncharacterized protein LOC109815231 [Cajanus cajan]|uniref:uncharacterized protein LOC109815231 n=1 Tax=Cajanus cajan TaxID=3821 RepID=UPI00098DCDA4|nr:uncharacterized protein LOC109815231 [Cajanus cajan]
MILSGDFKPPEWSSLEVLALSGGFMFTESENVNDIQEDMLNDICDKATQEPSESMDNVVGTSMASESMAIEKTSEEVQNNGSSQSVKAEITEEQRARMEANRLKALQKRAALAGFSQASQI